MKLLKESGAISASDAETASSWSIYQEVLIDSLISPDADSADDSAAATQDLDDNEVPVPGVDTFAIGRVSLIFDISLQFLVSLFYFSFGKSSALFVPALNAVKRGHTL